MNSDVLPHAKSGSVRPAAVDPPLAAYADQVREMQAIGQLFYQRGWSVGTSSNYSVVVRRDPLTLLITASGMDKGALRPTDFVLVDQAGRPTVKEQPKSSAETLLHCLLAEDPQVNAVLHTHSVWGTVLSQHFAADGGLAITDFEMLKGLEGVTTHEHREWIDIFDNSQQIPALVEAIRQRWSVAGPSPAMLTGKHGFLLRQHGLYTWGRDLFTARRHVEILEFLFECVARQLMLRGERPLP